MFPKIDSGTAAAGSGSPYGGSVSAAVLDGTLDTPDEFELANHEVIFAPYSYPARIKVSKKRNLSRSPNLCDGETVEDIGSKNREIHIVGIISPVELSALNNILDTHHPADLISNEWSGEVRIVSGDYEYIGKNTIRYTLDVISTGLDEYDSRPGSGVISE